MHFRVASRRGERRYIEPMQDVQLYQGDVAEPDSFNGYTRTLTARGGFLVTYSDQLRGMLIDSLRFFVWAAATCWSFKWLIMESPFSWLTCSVLLPLMSVGAWYLSRWPILKMHSLEVHPDGLIVDDKYFFPADEIGDNWPSLQMVKNDPDRMVFSGICGTRHIEYATANRRDKHDRTPERLAQDLEIAMEQLWGRRDEIYPI